MAVVKLGGTAEENTQHTPALSERAAQLPPSALFLIRLLHDMFPSCQFPLVMCVNSAADESPSAIFSPCNSGYVLFDRLKTAAPKRDLGEGRGSGEGGGVGAATFPV